MKKITAWLLAAVLSLGSMTVYAAPADRYELLSRETNDSGAREKETESVDMQNREEAGDASTEEAGTADSGGHGETEATEENTESMTETEAGSESEPETESESVTETEHETEPESETELPSETELETETQTEIETETETETEIETETETETETVFDEKASESGIDWDQIAVPADGKGTVRVILGRGIPLEKDVELKLSLKKDSETVREERVELSSRPGTEELVLDGLDAGSYKLTVEAEGFADYEQELQVDRNIQTAEIYTGFLDMEYKDGQYHPGALLIGDVNGDGAVNEADGEVLMDMMSASRSESTAEASTPKERRMADLNGDQAVDLLDLQYYAVTLNRLRNKVPVNAVLSARIREDAAGVGAGKGTHVEGDLEDILSSDGKAVVLSAGDGETISEETPVEIGIAFADADGRGVDMTQIVIRSEGIEAGTITVDTGNGEETWEVRDGRIADGQTAEPAGRSRSAKEGALKIDLGGQTAVKRVTIRVTAAQSGSNHLVEISQVEFLNGTEERIPEPDMNIPENLRAEAESRAFTVLWDKQPNVAGYEVEIEHEGVTEQLRTSADRVKVQSFQKKKLVNGEVYRVRVQSVNGAWESGFSDWIDVVPKANSRPDAPDYVKAAGGFRQISVSWKKMDDTDSYCVYYREKGQNTYNKVEAVESNSYVITGLKDKTRYEVYVTGVNELGESGPSLISEAETVTVTPAQMPKYRLLNEPGRQGELTSHIKTVTHGRGQMVDSPLDEGSAGSALGAADNDYGSYYQMEDWDDGVSYPGEGKGLTFTFDQPYEMNYIAFAEADELGSYSNASVYWYDEEHPEGQQAPVRSFLKKKDENGRSYYVIKLAEPVKTQKIRLGFTRSGGYRNIVVAEVNFYHYDSLEDDILALYADDLHTALKDGVTEADIEKLQKRLDTPDEKSGEYHPEREALQKELNNARGLLDSALGAAIEITPLITARKDGHLGFGGLNAWQPLGVTAYEGEQLVIYVGHNTLKTGQDTSLKLIATQHHAESRSLAAEAATLKVGRNEVTVPGLHSLAEEHGGALYIQYTGNNPDDRYAVRVSGGAKEPVLNLYGVTDEKERRERILSYVEELEEHVGQQEKLHEQLHEAEAGENSSVNRKYDPQNCILGATEIVLEPIMYSVSGEQILKALGSGSAQEKADRLDASLRAMEQMMHLFYQHKGLNDGESTPATDRLPAQHLNIRYMRMFKGAFMYAGGNHIGIEWDSVPALAGSRPVELDENGKYVSGSLFGWGIAHEIGHNINQGAYAIAEITNNYLSPTTILHSLPQPEIPMSPSASNMRTYMRK